MGLFKKVKAAVSNIRSTAKAAVGTGRELLRGPLGQMAVQGLGQAFGVPPQVSGQMYRAFGGQGFGNSSFGSMPPDYSAVAPPDGYRYNAMRANSYFPQQQFRPQYRATYQPQYRQPSYRSSY